MRSRTLTFQLFAGHGRVGQPRLPRRTGAEGRSVAGRQAPNFGGLQDVLKAGITCGSLSAIGDVLSQIVTSRMASPGSKVEVDPARTLRMGGFGFLLYGPMQHYWYTILGHQFPLRTASHFLTKVTLNQIALGPVVAIVAFAWTLGLQQQAHLIPGKIKADLLTTLVTGWKFWVPVSITNFCWVPVDKQVLYMSTCSLVWTTYLSYACNKQVPQVR
ncbi:unnamed protein product [Ostreobium quekettii]|uniref:Uncharacterized protein n=1 Tax=Ostreobium quekettii TaxID=121088 RepID=A0A8S1IJK3_9CHLO|nr:unnamed protein product [Ostreobium quekettii]